MIYIVAYDISSNRRRTRVAKALQSWGYRIQESVFQLCLDAAGLNAMRARLAALINAAEDVVHIYPLCSACAERAEILGAAVALDDVGLCRGGGELALRTRTRSTVRMPTLPSAFPMRSSSSPFASA